MQSKQKSLTTEKNKNKKKDKTKQGMKTKQSKARSRNTRGKPMNSIHQHGKAKNPSKVKREQSSPVLNNGKKEPKFNSNARPRYQQ